MGFLLPSSSWLLKLPIAETKITTHDDDVDDFYGCNGIEPANSALLHIAIKTTRNSFETWLAILLAVLIIVLFKLQHLNFIAE